MTDEHETIRPDRPPRDGLVRAQPGDFELRSSEGTGMPTMVGHFAVFDQWTEINSAFEGRFLERIAAGAFAKTFAENRDAIRVTFNHGKDPQLGDKVLGPIAALEEDTEGARYEVPLLDTTYNRDLLPGLEAGLYGSSFRFRVLKEEFANAPRKTSRNPDRLPERTITEAQVFEFGPVTYPAYAGASAGVRSLTDIYVLDRLTSDPELLAQLLAGFRETHALPDARAEAKPHSDEGSRSKAQAATPTKRFRTREEYLAWISSI
jgi:HK97 family phage prohead protease